MQNESPQKNTIPLINKNIQDSSSEGLTLDAFNLYGNTYQICRNWLKYHNYPLDNENIQRYLRIILILKEVVILSEEIKTVFHNNQLKKLGVFQKISSIITDKLGIEPDKIVPIANLTADFRIDSLDMLELMVAIEEAFDIEISAQTAQTLTTVQQIINYINQRV
ncbi:MAG: acyl carrier protein [Nostoc sp. ChiSLP02]|nr:acyl carrier protein [Nostoc sp. DedSLP05]MDZ8103250.1 acyl carrier protein [Nostoc sp. DedSLP01]MDZ8187697.1 acyl carrier protein [Nostoc sp. ChiSLP02]